MNNIPYLFVITGRPGSGKTTFAKKLGNEIHMPVIIRDEIKEGYIHTFGKSHSHLPQESNKVVTEIFFDTLNGLISNNVSVIAEAAFQHGVWSHMLDRFAGKANIFLLICKVDENIALDRFLKRGLDSDFREYFHGDKDIDLFRNGADLTIRPYDEPHLDFPSLHIDTTGDYSPTITELKEVIFNHRI